VAGAVRAQGAPSPQPAPTAPAAPTAAPAPTAPAKPPAADTAEAQEAAQSSTDTDPTFAPHVDPKLLTERHMREPEILHAKPSGFWTSNRPATGGAYRYRLMLLGVGIAAIMATIMIVVIRRGARRPAA